MLKQLEGMIILGNVTGFSDLSVAVTDRFPRTDQVLHQVDHHRTRLSEEGWQSIMAASYLWVTLLAAAPGPARLRSVHGPGSSIGHQATLSTLARGCSTTIRGSRKRPNRSSSPAGVARVAVLSNHRCDLRTGRDI